MACIDSADLEQLELPRASERYPASGQVLAALMNP